MEEASSFPRSSLVIAHAGLNTVLDSFAAGVPPIVIPITYKQPAIAGRVERTAPAGGVVRAADIVERCVSRHVIAPRLAR
jgi:UDP:flavonoid glycosyltransferase YjiC (YdhE family)